MPTNDPFQKNPWLSSTLQNEETIKSKGDKTNKYYISFFISISSFLIASIGLLLLFYYWPMEGYIQISLTDKGFWIAPGAIAFFYTMTLYHLSFLKSKIRFLTIGIISSILMSFSAFLVPAIFEDSIRDSVDKESGYFILIIFFLVSLAFTFLLILMEKMFNNTRNNSDSE